MESNPKDSNARNLLAPRGKKKHVATRSSLQAKVNRSAKEKEKVMKTANDLRLSWGLKQTSDIHEAFNAIVRDSKDGQGTQYEDMGKTIQGAYNGKGVPVHVQECTVGVHKRAKDGSKSPHDRYLENLPDPALSGFGMGRLTNN